MKKAILLAAAFVVLIALIAGAGIKCVRSTLFAKPTTNTQAVARKVENQRLISTTLPAVRLELNKAFGYVGNQTFILYDVANAEQHFFVDADSQGRIKRMYWVQFEGYLPNNTHSYDYKSDKTITIGGLEFVADAYARNLRNNPSRPNSDGSRMRSYLEGKGYRMASDEILMQRLVHLVDKEKRNELMIIYIEDMGGTGLTAEGLNKNGSVAARWEEVSKALLERAIKGMKITGPTHAN